MRKIDRFLVSIVFIVFFAHVGELIWNADDRGAVLRKPLTVHAPMAVPPHFSTAPLADAVIKDEPIKYNSRYTGSAFALSKAGHWGTALHVMNGCKRIDAQLENGRGGFKNVAVTSWRALKGTDVAVFDTDNGKPGLPLAHTPPRKNDAGFFFGYPKGQANAGYAVFVGEARMVRRRGQEREHANVWAIYDFVPATEIVLGGNSGGPMFNARGEVVGVVSAGNDRRGRVLTSVVPDLKPLDKFSRPAFKGKTALTRSNFVDFGAELRQRGLVVRVNCAT